MTPFEFTCISVLLTVLIGSTFYCTFHIRDRLIECTDRICDLFKWTDLKEEFSDQEGRDMAIKEDFEHDEPEWDTGCDYKDGRRYD